MPYRILKGQQVFLQRGNKVTGRLYGSLDAVVMQRTIDLPKERLLASPLSEHHKEGIPSSNRVNLPWKFDVNGLWTKGSMASEVHYLYAGEVHVVEANTDKSVKTALIHGSKSNVYTVTLNEYNVPISCSCPAHRFRRQECKHMTAAANGRTHT
jgi:hypothetical protein